MHALSNSSHISITGPLIKTGLFTTKLKSSSLHKSTYFTRVMPEFKEKHKISFCRKQTGKLLPQQQKTTQIFCKLHKSGASFACQSQEL